MRGCVEGHDALQEGFGDRMVGEECIAVDENLQQGNSVRGCTIVAWYICAMLLDGASYVAGLKQASSGLVVDEPAKMDSFGWTTS